MPDKGTVNNTGPILILSDGKPGHYNQAVAFARLQGLSFEIREVAFRNRACKALSYLFDALHISTSRLFTITGDVPSCNAIVSAGSDTYYANRVLSGKLGVRSVAIMLPKSYRYDFDLIVAQQHDKPPTRANILALPVNLSCPEPRGIVQRINDKQCVSVIIGGSSQHVRMDTARIKKQLHQIYELFPDADILATTSRRTPGAVEALIEQGPFRYKVIASRESINPVPDFLEISDYVFVTEDSTSMISEAVSFGEAFVEVLPVNGGNARQKYKRFIEGLVANDCLHLFNGSLGNKRNKIKLADYLKCSSNSPE